MQRRVELSSGIEVELRPVPSYVLLQVARKFPLPDIPTKTVQTAAGEQEVELGVDSPEYQEWMKEYDQTKQQQMEADWAASLDYGIVRWRNKPCNRLHKLLGALGLGYQWESEPPADWEIPGPLKTLMDSTGNKRLDYIYVMLLADPRDLGNVLSELTFTTRDLNVEEVETAEASFRNGVEGDEAAEGTGDRGEGTDDVLRDGGGEVVGDDTEGVVQ